MKPIAGYPSMRIAVLALSEQGKKPLEISEQLGISKSHVYDAINRPHVPKRGTPVRVGRSMTVSEDTIEIMEPFAAARGIPVQAFIREILDTVAADNLFSAILDN